MDGGVPLALNDLDVVKIHLGKPPRSTMSSIVPGAWRGGIRGVGRRSASAHEPTPLPDGDRIGVRALVKLVRKVMTSRDRYLSTSGRGGSPPRAASS